MPDAETLNPWWADLRHGGMIISPTVLDETFPEGTRSVDGRPYQRLRDAWNRFDAWLAEEGETSSSAGPLHEWLDAVLEEYLGHATPQWLKGSRVEDRFKTATIAGERLRPNRVLMRNASDEAALLVMVDRSKRVGIGRGRRAYANLLHLLRATGNKLGLLTNGVQFRLVYAGLDHDAWVEWDAESWFAEAELRRQLGGLVTLLGPAGTEPRDGLEFPLLEAVEQSRTRQGELSQVMGEQVRQAIETILAHVDRAARANPELLAALRTDPESGSELPEADWLQALYQAATRLVMRLVVALFAEARDLLPKSLETYYHSYSVEGLFEHLERAHAHEGPSSLEDRWWAWPRVMALFRLIHEGCGHEAIPVLEYGGTLFRRGDSEARDPVLRALAIFEAPAFEMNDLAVLRVLRLLKIGKVKARRGRSATWVSGPVDFSDLRTEYIGMIYEGLLDFQLRLATQEQGAVVFLNIGQEPALPLPLIQGMDDRTLRDLLAELRKEKAPGPSTGDEEEEASEEEAVEEEAEEEAQEEADEPEEEPEEALTEQEELRRTVHEWAVRAVEVAAIVRKPRGKKPDLYAYEKEREEAARRLIRRVISPGQMYLIRSGGTRKGTGTFYTRPQLAVPTTRRTLEPLAYDVADEGEKTPKTPEEILSLKVVDPAMGSGSFLVAAVRYLTDALYDSLRYHGRIRAAEAGSVITLPLGEPSEAEPQEEVLPVPPDDEHFEDMLKARLKRHIVERCIYGVDINPMAVELARLSLWVETMARELPFEFLDHKLKVGNSLIGCWLDRFEDYPARAWDREAGDSGADYRAVNFEKSGLTKRIKSIRKDVVKGELRAWIEARGPQQQMRFGDERETGLEVQAEAREQFEAIHELARDQREEAYREWQNSDEFQELKEAFDRWCAIWFWPVDDPDAPLVTPARFHEDNERIREMTHTLWERHRFFHWELEFPDVFTPERQGFDAVLGNPPWEIMKPNSKEFFSRYDPIYRMRGKQEALGVQEEVFERDPTIERDWLRYCGFHKAMSNWVRESEDPFDFPLSGSGQKQLKQQWAQVRGRRQAMAHRDHPYVHQGSADLNSYKMFLEVSHHLLRQGGRLGMLVPSGIYGDKGSGDLRALFLDRCDWEWLFGFENRKGIFRIHRSFKFCPVILQRGGETDNVRTAFMRHDLEDWERPDPPSMAVTREQVKRFSPETLAFLELSNQRELDICEKLYADHPLLADEAPDGSNVEPVREFDADEAGKAFHPLRKWTADGFVPTPYGWWVGPSGDTAIPVWEGRMIDQFDFCRKGWVSGKGRSAVWRDIPVNAKVIEPQFVMALGAYAEREKATHRSKLTYMRIGSATNTRTMISSVVPDVPCLDTTPVIAGCRLRASLCLSAVLNSFACDFAVRRRCGGLHVDFHHIEPTPLPLAAHQRAQDVLVKWAAVLTFVHSVWAPDWLRLGAEHPELGETRWQELWAIDEAERLRLRCIIDAIVAELYGLDYDDLAYILRIDPDDAKGFWRVDKNLPEEQRQTTLTLQAFEHLKEVGLEAFCEQGWELPDYARRFREERQDYVWQPTEDWDDCEQHAHNIIGEEGWADFQNELAAISRGEHPQPTDPTRGQQELPEMPEGEQKRLI